LNPNSAQIASIRSFVSAMSGQWTNTDDAIRVAMQADQVSNPISQGTVPQVFTAASVLASGDISNASIAKLLGLPSFSDHVIPLLNTVGKQSADIQNLNQWAAAYFLGGALQQAEFDSLAAPTPGTSEGAPTGLFNVTIEDPSWTSTVGFDVANLGRPVDDYDIEVARFSS
jgi:hypothetical protein